jgi:PD-(D/E)XK nuclease superfamily
MWLLTGTPDAVFLRAKKTYIIADYKTARFTNAQDELLPMYEVQVNAYAYIGERTGLVRPVAGLCLVYMEPVTDSYTAADPRNVTPDGFTMGFHAFIQRVELATAKIPDLLSKVRAIYNMSKPPEGRAGCSDCARLKQLISVALETRNQAGLGKPPVPLPTSLSLLSLLRQTTYHSA